VEIIGNVCFGDGKAGPTASKDANDWKEAENRIVLSMDKRFSDVA
jgi:hypothetical protein